MGGAAVVIAVRWPASRRVVALEEVAFLVGPVGEHQLLSECVGDGNALGWEPVECVREQFLEVRRKSRLQDAPHCRLVHVEYVRRRCCRP